MSHDDGMDDDVDAADRRLFVDCDDTLVLFEGDGPHPYGAYDEEGTPNRPLIDRVNAFEGHVVVWSGGGSEYARFIGERYLSREFLALAKDVDGLALVRPGDIVVDDQPISARTHGPHRPWT